MEHTIIEQAEVIITQLENELRLIKADNPLQLAEKSYQATIPAAKELKEVIEKNKFSGSKEEIQFYKHIKPQICQQLIYYIELFHLEASRPFAKKENIEAYLMELLNKYQLYFERNLGFYNYYRMGQTHMDAIYFTNNEDTPVPVEVTVECDPSSAAAYATITGRFIAYDRLIDYIQREIHQLNNPFDAGKDKESGQLVWTDTKAAFIELVYALHCSGAIDNGQGDMKNIVKILENVFQLRAGNYYAVFHQNIRLRKINKTAFLDKLKALLLKHVDYCDQMTRPNTKSRNE